MIDIVVVHIRSKWQLTKKGGGSFAPIYCDGFQCMGWQILKELMDELFQQRKKVEVSDTETH